VNEAVNTVPPCPSPFPSTVRNIGVFCPAGAPPPEKLAKGCRKLRQWGFHVCLAVPDSAPDRYLAASDEERVQAFHQLLEDESVDAIMAARGGYGCARLLDRIDWQLWETSPKPVIGYSDLTALHLGALRHGITTGICGPMVASEMARGLDEPATAAFTTAVHWFARAWGAGECSTEGALASATVLQPGAASGFIVPATLAVLVSLLGTTHMPDLEGAILVLEDINEAAYRVDRYLTQLRQTGVLQHLSGLVLGAFGGCDYPEWLPQTFEEFAGHVPGPVISGLPFGHRFPSLSFPVGRTGFLEAGDEIRFSWL